MNRELLPELVGKRDKKPLTGGEEFFYDILGKFRDADHKAYLEALAQKLDLFSVLG